MIKYFVGLILLFLSFNAFSGSATENTACIQYLGNDLQIIYHYKWKEKDTIEQLKSRVSNNEWARTKIYPMIERAYMYEDPQKWAEEELELCKKEKKQS